MTGLPVTDHHLLLCCCTLFPSRTRCAAVPPLHPCCTPSARGSQHDSYSHSCGGTRSRAPELPAAAGAGPAAAAPGSQHQRRSGVAPVWRRARVVSAVTAKASVYLQCAVQSLPNYWITRMRPLLMRPCAHACWTPCRPVFDSAVAYLYGSDPYDTAGPNQPYEDDAALLPYPSAAVADAVRLLQQGVPAALAAALPGAAELRVEYQASIGYLQPMPDDDMAQVGTRETGKL